MVVSMTVISMHRRTVTFHLQDDWSKAVFAKLSLLEPSKKIKRRKVSHSTTVVENSTSDKYISKSDITTYVWKS